MKIKHANIFYIPNFNVIGGTEQFMYEIAKKYHKYDIAVIYENGDENQIKRLREFIPVYKYKGQDIECDKLFCNYSTKIANKVNAKEYVQIIHAMYKSNKINPVIEPKINKYIAVSEIAKKEYEELTNKKVEVFRNPLSFTKEDKERVLVLISATRLTKEKGKERIEKLAKKLDEKKSKWIWLIFTNDKDKINNKNIIYLPPRLDVRPFLELAKGKGYGVQLSDCEGDCYFTRECEAVGLPLLVTPLPSFEEQGLVEGKNCYYIPFNVEIDDKIDKIINEIPTYSPYIRDDNWEDMLVKNKSNYEEERKMKVKVKALSKFEGVIDAERKVEPKVGDEWETTKERADMLQEKGYVEIIEIIKEKTVEKKPTKKKKS